MANIEIFGTLVRNDSNTNRDKIVQAVQVDGGYFVCAALPTTGTWQKGQLCYYTGTGTADKPGNNFYQYDGSKWEVALNPPVYQQGTNIDITNNTISVVDNPKVQSIGIGSTTSAPVSLQYDSSINALKFVFS